MPAEQQPLPTLYLSHGSPMIAVQDSPTQRFLKRLGPAIDASFGRPRAVVILSAHSQSRTPGVLAAPQHHAIHDFGGFPEALYRLRYNAPGDADLAQQVSQLLGVADFDAPALAQGGIDHGIWTVLMHMWPDASMPVVPVLLPAWARAQDVFNMGQALHLLAASQVLVIGSGSLTHNLRRAFSAMSPATAAEPPDEDADCAAFRQWVHACVDAGNWPSLLAWQTQAPHAQAVHPTDEHWLPFYFAAGAAGAASAAGEAPTGMRLHADVEMTCLSLDAYAFGSGAQALGAALAA